MVLLQQLLLLTLGCSTSASLIVGRIANLMLQNSSMQVWGAWFLQPKHLGSALVLRAVGCEESRGGGRSLLRVPQLAWVPSAALAPAHAPRALHA